MSSYIAALPSEVLTQILRDHFSFVSSSLHKSNWNLYAPIRVCSLWRETALNDPFNWVFVEIEIDLDHLEETAWVAGIQGRERAIQRIINEARWRLSRVKDAPVDLKISFPHIYQESDYRNWDLILDMTRKFLQESFGARADPTSPRIRLGVYEENGHFLAPVLRKGFFFDDMIPMMQPEQYSKLSYLATVNPDIQDSVTFPNLTELRVFLDWRDLKLLSKIVAPRLWNLQIFSHSEPGDQEVNINSLLTSSRFPCLTTLAVNGSLSSTLSLTSRPQSPEQRNSPILTINIINPNYKPGIFPWKLSPFLQSFPNLQEIIFRGNTSTYNEDGEQLAISKSVLSIGFIDHLDNKLARQLPEIFPNLTDLHIGKEIPKYHGAIPHVKPDVLTGLFEMLAAIKEMDGAQVPCHLPHFEDIWLHWVTMDKATFLALIGCIKARHLQATLPTSAVAENRSVFPQCRISMTGCRVQWSSRLDILPPQLGVMKNLSWPAFSEEILEFLLIRIGLNMEEVIQQTGGLLVDF
jgi:hypothetical protein